MWPIVLSAAILLDKLGQHTITLEASLQEKVTIPMIFLEHDGMKIIRKKRMKRSKLRGFVNTPHILTLVVIYKMASISSKEIESNSSRKVAVPKRLKHKILKRKLIN